MDRPGDFGEDGARGLDRRGSPKGVTAGDHLVEHDAEREDVAARVGGLGPQLLGRHVGHGADDLSGRGEAIGQRVLGGAAGTTDANPLGDAEVEDLDVSLSREHQVGRLDVAMDETHLVGRRESLGRFVGNADDLVERQGPSLNAVCERLPLDQLHHDQRRIAHVFDAEDLADEGVIQRRGGTGLAQESLPLPAVVAELGEQCLDRHVAPEHGVPGAIHRSHASLAEEGQDVVGADRPSDQGDTPFVVAADASALRSRKGGW